MVFVGGTLNVELGLIWSFVEFEMWLEGKRVDEEDKFKELFKDEFEGNE